MTDNAQSIEIAEIIFTLQILIDHQQELLAEGKAQGQTNDEHVKQISAMIRQLTGLLKTYQDNAQSITDNTIQSIKNTINVAFEKNQESYHALINKGFTTHIDTATKKLSTVADKVEEELEGIRVAAINSKTEFEGRQNYFKLYEDIYDEQSRKLRESVDETLTNVAKDTEVKLSDVGHDFTAALTWKMTGMLGAICLGLISITFAIAWLFIPSKADIAERRANYAALERYQVADNVAKGTDGYYADVISSTCFKGRDGNTWCKFR